MKSRKFKELLKKIENLIRSIDNNSDDYDEKYTRLRSNSDDNFSLKIIQ